ncbi:MAG: V-type ATP synthase subunit D [Candidatus Omnitrophica bacterium]|nr:V-type ATP synthase subunit D [Candidatus Omnitrophota bacterium]
MPGKLKLTKNQLKKEKDALKMFQRYLPMLQLKKQQLQLELARIKKQREEREGIIKQARTEVEGWIEVFAQSSLKGWLTVKKINTTVGNVAGVEIPVFQEAEIEKKPYDFMQTPLWVDFALEKIEAILREKAALSVLKRQEELVGEELRIATQRVNLFEKVMIPRTQENIRVIKIYLGDMQTAEVVRGKIAKAKAAARREALKI